MVPGANECISILGGNLILLTMEMCKTETMIRENYI